VLKLLVALVLGVALLLVVLAMSGCDDAGCDDCLVQEYC
jgi:hypothetical protein